MLRVWVDGRTVGVLDRFGRTGSTFVYDANVDPEDAVSVTMPRRTASWDTKFGMLPIFDMNMPEGALKERLTRRFAKAAGTFDEHDLLTVVGGSQVGRVRLSSMDGRPDDEVPFASVHDVLRARRGGEFFEYLMDTFARYSGLSGVQPKVMLRTQEEGRRSHRHRCATHIVKFWDKESPELAANEFFCLQAAKRMGLEVPAFDLSEDGDALMIERFDLKDGRYLGFEDFCVLNGVTSAEKYKGGYETRLFKRLRDFVHPDDRFSATAAAFELVVLNCAVRNGDAHLKNFALTYASPDGRASLAPVYDIVTTRAYLPKDAMALTMGGSTDWPDKRKLVLLGQTRTGLSPLAISNVFEKVADAMSDVAPEARRYFEQCPHPEVGQTMMEAWQDGIDRSLGMGGRTSVVVPAATYAP